MHHTSRKRGLGVRSSLAIAAMVLAAIFVSPRSESSRARHGAPAAAANAVAASEPRFVENNGQWRDGVKALATAGPVTAWCLDDGFRLELQGAGGDRPRSTVVDLEFEGAGRAEVQLEGRQLARTHYLIGNDPGAWVRGVASHDSILYEELYPGISARLRGQDGLLEYDVLLEAGADLDAVVVRCDGHTSMRIGPEGELVLATELGEIRQAPPTTWLAAADGARTPVECRYRILDGARYGFAVEAARGDRTLVIDPAISWSTYLGGSANEAVGGVHVDDDGITTVATTTRSTDFPTTVGTQPIAAKAVAITQLDPCLPAGSQILWSTIIDGSLDDQGLAVQPMPNGDWAVAGVSESADFPTTAGAFQPAHDGPVGTLTCVLLVLAADGSTISYSTFLGGPTGEDFIWWNSLAVEPNGILTIAGFTAATGFPTTAGAFQATAPAGNPYNAFVASIDPAEPVPASQLVYGTYVGGTGGDGAWDVAVDPGGVVTVVGETVSADFPVTAGAFPFQGGLDPRDAFVTRLDRSQSGASQLVWSTFFGGVGAVPVPGPGIGEGVRAIELSANGMLVVGGITDSDNLPIQGAFQAARAGSWDAFVAWLDPSQPPSQSIVFASYLGGAGFDECYDLKVDASDSAVLVGYTESGDFPTTAGAFSSGPATGGTGFVARVRPLPSNRLNYSTLLTGSAAFTAPQCLALDRLGRPTVGGITFDASFPVVCAAQSTFQGGGDGFLTRLELLPLGVDAVGASTASCRGPSYVRVTEQPTSPSVSLAIEANQAPPFAFGVFALATGTNAGVALPGLGITMYIDPPIGTVGVATDALGTARVPLPIPAGFAGTQIGVQFAFLETLTCAGAQTLTATNALGFTIQ